MSRTYFLLLFVPQLIDLFFSSYDENSECLSEDRQWDSGGCDTVLSKLLPSIPVRQQSSNSNDGYFSR